MPKILIVDDDEDIRQWLEAVLEGSGYVVTSMDHPEGVVRLLLTGDIDLALIDYHLPGKDGLSLLRDIRDKNMSLPVVVLTSEARQRVAVECFRNGAADFIAKPIDPDYLSIVVERALNNHAGTLKNMAYRALGYVHHKDTCSHFTDSQTCNCGLREVIENIQDF
ncbi:MAG: response regulator [Magnetovibrio sp.]|nr:response regulator [Magnetovibrio sp.]